MPPPGTAEAITRAHGNHTLWLPSAQKQAFAASARSTESVPSGRYRLDSCDATAQLDAACAGYTAGRL